MLSGIVIRATATVRTNSISSILRRGHVLQHVAQHRAFATATSRVDRHRALGCGSGRVAERMDEADAIAARLAHPHDPARSRR